MNERESHAFRRQVLSSVIPFAQEEGEYDLNGEIRAFFGPVGTYEYSTTQIATWKRLVSGCSTWKGNLRLMRKLV